MIDYSTLERMLYDLEWTKPAVYGQHRVAHLRSTARIIDRPKVAAWIADYLDPPYHNFWFAKIDPGGFVAPHIDTGPYMQRWHFPVKPAGFFWQDGETWEMDRAFMVKHWLPHAVWNPTDRPRIHLMVERDITPPDAPTEVGQLVVCPLIPEIEDLIARQGLPSPSLQ